MPVSNTVSFATPDTLYPVSKSDGSPLKSTVFLRPAVNHPRMTVGDYTYASAFDDPEDWASRLAPYLFDFSPERLIIGKFCQIADGVTFITASANHRFDGISSYPFAIFDAGPMEGRPSMPESGKDTVVGNDVWFGKGAMILPGAQIGDGVIVGAGAVVSGDVPAYTIIGGNPAKQVRRRFSEAQAAELKRIAWWNWPIAMIQKHEGIIMAGDVVALARVPVEE